MENNKVVYPWKNLAEGKLQSVPFFFLNNLLRARADLNLESGRHEHDQEVNVYLAGLFTSVISSESFLRQKEHVSPFDVDVRRYLDEHPGVRMEYIVYKDNAEFGLVSSGVFSGCHHPGSYHREVMSGVDPAGRIALYYELAASALMHLGVHTALIDIFGDIADHCDDILAIMSRAATHYFELLDRLSEGSIFHLHRELEFMTNYKAYQTKLDDFLREYSLYKLEPSEERKQTLLSLAGELSLLNENFKFEELKD